MLFKLLASNVSMRRCALILNIHRTTVKRKFSFLATRSLGNLEDLHLKLSKTPVEHIQFDDLITIEHTKLKPLSVSIAVDVKRRFILGAEVSQIPAFGHLARLSRKKYGPRKSRHKEGLKRLFETLRPIVSPTGIVESDEHKFYPEFVRNYLPRATYNRYKGGRGCVAGQGELKKLHQDPLFILNHTCALFRANINRLIRKTWCTTKDPAMLQKHLYLFIDFHNTQIFNSIELL